MFQASLIKINVWFTSKLCNPQKELAPSSGDFRSGVSTSTEKREMVYIYIGRICFKPSPKYKKIKGTIMNSINMRHNMNIGCNHTTKNAMPKILV